MHVFGFHRPSFPAAAQGDKLLIAMLVALSCMTPAHASSIHAVHGKVQVLRGDKTLWAVAGTTVREGDEITSEEGAEAIVRFDDGARLAVRSNTQMAFDALLLKGPSQNRKKAIKIVKGGLRYISGRTSVKNSVAFQTDTATIGIRGTDIEIAVTADALNDNPAGTYLKVNTGQAVLEAVDGVAVAVESGQVAFGSEPELVPRGPGLPRRPSARKVALQSMSLFGGGKLDGMMK